MGEPTQTPKWRHWGTRFGWLAAYWVFGVAALALAAYLLRLVMNWAGFNS